jgi:phage terminase small subunit
MGKVSLPGHLKTATKEWISKILNNYELEDHHINLLILAGECWDRIIEARAEVKKEGAYYKDRWGCPKSNPALADERNNRIVFARLLRELNLSEESPDTRPPGLKY